jgi:hypothetical protein
VFVEILREGRMGIGIRIGIMCFDGSLDKENDDLEKMPERSCKSGVQLESEKKDGGERVCSGKRKINLH